MRRLLALGLVILASGCTPVYKTKQVSAQQLTRGSLPRLQCGYRLAPIQDMRRNDQAGTLDDVNYRIDNMSQVLADQLAVAGWSQDSAQPLVSIEVHHLYVITRGVTRVPNAAYRVTIGDRAPMAMRAQVPRSNYWGASEQSGYDSLAEAMHQANLQLIAELNRSCRTR